MFSVGLTGGVGSGKSTIAAMLSARGAGIIDADAISHELTQAGAAAIEPLRARFGAEAIAADGSLDRARMRARVFFDQAARTQLEALLHPMIRAAMRERAARLVAAGRPYVAFVVPLLVETGNWRSIVDRVLLVDCSEATQIARVCTRAGMSEQTARQIISVQASRQDRLAVADDVLMNEAPLAEIEDRVERLHREYARRAAVK
ncbi:MAG TPA: dephospho-CoA kinase [Burkholderiaceae bacterium]|nr:dephospho-CoA kinase [Burkholderiaceae bacterium]